MSRTPWASALASATAILFSMSFSHADPNGALTPELLTNLRSSYEMNATDRARYNAITNNSIKELALNREIISGQDGHFSHKIKTKGVTNQKSSGRCWMFAGFNVMRPKVISEFKLENFEFSTSYLQFWDKMEKSNLYLENIIELRNADRLDREWLLINEWMVGDGGWWNYVTGLIEKYGVVPASIMPETHSSENTSAMNSVLDQLLRTQAAKILKAHENGATEADLRAQKEKDLQQVYRFLVINLGEPPTEFEWLYKIKAKTKDEDKDEDAENAVVQNLSEPKTYTPKSFYQDFVGVDLKDFVCLYNDPSQELNAHYRFNRAKNMAGQDDMNFANIDIAQMKEVAVKSVLANEPMWFAVNMGVDQSTEHGIMEINLYDYESLFGIELGLTKAERSHFGAGASNHAMVLMGVNLKDGAPTKWLVENSWGDAKGKKGQWTLYDNWFTEHVYTIIVNRKHVSDKTLAIFEQEPKTLPTWYPGVKGIDSK